MKLNITKTMTVITVTLIVFPSPLSGSLSLVTILVDSIITLIPLLCKLIRCFVLSTTLNHLTFRRLVGRPRAAGNIRRVLQPGLKRFFLLLMRLLIVCVIICLNTILLSDLTNNLINLFFNNVINKLAGTDVNKILKIDLNVLTKFLIFVMVLVQITSLLFVTRIILTVRPGRITNGDVQHDVRLSGASIKQVRVVVLTAFLVRLPVAVLAGALPDLLVSTLPDSMLLPDVRRILGTVLDLKTDLFVLPV